MTEPVEHKKVVKDDDVFLKQMYVVEETKSDDTPDTEILPHKHILGNTVFEDRDGAAAAIAYKLAEYMSKLATEMIAGHEPYPFHVEFFASNGDEASIDYGLERHLFRIVRLKVRDIDYNFVKAEDS